MTHVCLLLPLFVPRQDFRTIMLINCGAGAYVKALAPSDALNVRYIVVDRCGNSAAIGLAAAYECCGGALHTTLVGWQPLCVYVCVGRKEGCAVVTVGCARVTVPCSTCTICTTCVSCLWLQHSSRASQAARMYSCLHRRVPPRLSSIITV
jgi:hypothetical protein